MTDLKRPYLTHRVAAGIASIASRVVPQDEQEEHAVIWMHRVARWRALQCAQLEPQDAERLSPERGAGAPSGSPGDAP